MAIYITQGNYTERAMQGLVENPQDRKGAVTGLMESVGARLLDYYVTTGKYDFLVISEGENLTDLIAGLMVAGSTGGVANLNTVQALTTAEAKVAMEKANAAQSSFRAAG